MREDLSCLRCGEKMQLIRREFIQLGKAGVFPETGVIGWPELWMWIF